VICEAFLERVDALLDGTLARSDREDMLRHLENCADCRGLFAALVAAGDAPEDPGLAAAILARTSGAACASARSRLCARVDGELEAFDAELVDGHLRCCPECEGLARALEWIEQDLPRLATIDPGPGFVEWVLARTSRSPRRMPLGARLDAMLAHLLDRPRVAWEGAFAATLILFAPVFVPGSPFGDLPRQALGQLRGTVNQLEATLVVGARDAWATAGAVVVEGSSELASGFARQSTDTLQSIRQRLGTFHGSAASGQTSGGTETNDTDPDAAQEKRR